MLATGYYLPVYQEDIPKGKIAILLTEDSHAKIQRMAATLTGRTDAKIPVRSHRGDHLLIAKINTVTMFMKGGEASCQSELLGSEITARIKLRKYCVVSKYEHNRGEKIYGTTASILELTAL